MREMTAGSDGALRYWPGHGPIPFRGELPPLTKEELFAEQRIDTTAEPHVEVFDFSDPDDLGRYSRILGLVANERAIFGFCEFKYDEDLNNWRALIHWTELFQESADEAAKKKLSI